MKGDVVSVDMMREMHAHAPFALANNRQLWEWQAAWLTKAIANPNVPCPCCNVTPDGDALDHLPPPPRLLSQRSTPLDLARMPERDKDGFASHPDLHQLLCDPPADTDGADLYIDPAKVHAAGLELAHVSMEEQLLEDHPTWQAYFENGATGCAGWNPEPPAGDGWRCVAIYDTESGDGPAAMFVRQSKPPTLA